jgi:uncharacterized membrane protein YphA (DoxX/SURF4 family)
MSDRRELVVSWLLPLARLAVAGVLIYAGLQKLPNIRAFAEIIGNFKMLRAESGQLLAVILPWCEVTTGLFLLCGLWLRAAGLMSLLMFCAFTTATGSLLARGLKTECGCFGTDSIVDWRTLAIDLAGVVAATAIIWMTSVRRRLEV